ncbi:MAG TPA: cytochrome P450 [Pseudonocardiaceae bacterium]|jgi:cytochrome P450
MTEVTESAPQAGGAEGLSFASLPFDQDRTAALRELRARGPVAALAGGGYAVVGREAAEHVLRRPDLFSSQLVFAGVGSPLPMPPIEFDPPEHTRYRRMLQSYFTPRAVAAQREDIRGAVAGLIERFAGTGRCDVLADLALPLPAAVFIEFFGLPSADRERLTAWKEALSSHTVASGRTTPSAESVRAGRELHAYLAAQVDRLRSAPGGRGVLAALLDTPEGRALSDAELQGMSFQFVLAGLDTVTSSITNAFAVLAEHSWLRQTIVAEPDRIPEIVDELLRIAGPVFVVPRVTTTEVDVEGVTIAAGERVFVVIAAANRDAKDHDEPDQVALGHASRNLAFGAGVHRCIGLHLARVELQVLLAEWHQRIPDYRVVPNTVPHIPWPAALIGVRSLQLEFP